MKSPSVQSPRRIVLWLIPLLAGLTGAAGAAIPLADAPIGATIAVPANVILDLSVEFPTAVGDAYYSTTTYSAGAEFIGYFNPNYCYDYVTNSGSNAQTAQFETLAGYFKPITPAANHACTGHWSGNYLNWVNTQTIDTLRKTLTGGARIVDGAGVTVLQKAYQDSQGGSSNQRTKSIVGNAALVQGATPFNWSSIYTNNLNTGLNFLFSQTNSFSSPVAFNGTAGTCPSPNASSGTVASSGSTSSGDFKLSIPSALTLAAANCAGTVSISVQLGSGISSVDLSVTGLPSGVTATGWSSGPSAVTGSGTTLTLTADGTTAPATTNVTITAKKHGASSPNHSVTLVLTTQATAAYSAQSAVMVCSSVDAPSDLETAGGRCRAYGANQYKPVGLMQKYAAESTLQRDVIRYSAFGYLLDTAGTSANQKLDGGVMRARMKSVGPYQANPGQAVAANAAQEWDKSTGVFIANPDTGDASASGVSRSGVANYLNLFGFVPTAQYSPSTRAAYKRYDSVSELYYMALRYYRNLGNLASHTTTATAITNGEATKDNFPVITSWDDPIKYSCSTNYVVGIGDIHTWNDGNVPGSTLNGGYEVADAGVAADTAVDAKAATNWIANLENLAKYTGAGTGGATPNNGVDIQGVTGLGGLFASVKNSPNAGSTIANTCCDGNTYLMAGLAYDAHVRDIRPDIVSKNKPVTVSTFWLDVMESNEYREKNQFWMTAKYGGFNTDDPVFGSGGYPLATNGTPATYPSSVQNTPLPTSAWNTNGYQDDRGNFAPDQYYQAGNPAKMAAGLNSAFAKISAHVPKGTSTSLAAGSSTFATSGNANYSTSYSDDWSGNVFGDSLSLSATGGTLTGTSTNVWKASALLPPSTTPVNSVTPLTYDTRIIATSSAPGANKGVPFRVSSISTSETSALGSNAGNVLNYVRGDQCNETLAGTALSPACQTVTGNTQSLGFRDRPKSVLGDITNSKPLILAAPAFPYADAPLNPGYAAFKSQYTNSSDGSSKRGVTVFVSSNDGMLHAFDGSVDAGGSGGKERFAYVPSYLFNTNTDTNGNPVGLASLTLGTAKSYNHHFMVDAQPVVYDVDFHATGGATTTTAAQSDWHSVLIGGLGKGGKGYFAIDVSDPTAITDEAGLASKVLWETDPASTAYAHMGYSYGTPIVVKTKTYGWTVVLTSGYNNDNGVGYIYLVNPKDGSLYQTISTGAGTTANPAGLTYVEAGVPNASDFTADSLYAGDLLGNVWRVDLTNSSFAVTQLATLTDGTNPQPVTTKPALGIDPTSLKRYVFVGTGRLLDDSDLVSSQKQTFYAIQDGTNNAFDSTITTPITRAKLHDDTGLSTGANLTGFTLAATEKGFYIDLKTYAASAGLLAGAERVNISPVAAAGVVGFAANLSGRDVCAAGSARVFALSYDSASGAGYGGTLLSDYGGAATNALSYSNGTVNSLTFGTDSGGNMIILAGLGGNSATPSVQGGTLKPTAGTTMNKINWREVPEAQ